MSDAKSHYDVIVIGGGHAGAEAAWAAANMGADALLITMDPTKIGAMSCNPAIGGLAKGQIVREIDALGGLMGLAIDATGIQFKMLNQSKGPAVRGPRAQADKYRYAREVQRLLSTRGNLTILAGTVDDILVEDGRIQGVVASLGDAKIRPEIGHPELRFGHVGEKQVIRTPAVVLTTGTFMRGLMHTGESKTAGGRVGDGAAVGISATLQHLGFELGRLKTGTPPRIAAESIDFAKVQEQPGDDEPVPFSDLTEHRGTLFPAIEQRLCWTTRTDPKAHQLIRDNLHRAPMYNGQITDSTGPRYCPSIEDKVVRFAERESHGVFLEPESLDTNEIYCNGISTSLPEDVQDLIVHTMPGCEKAKILRYGYAVEYDMVWPHQIDATCMTKRIEGFFLAGQINGTSGYEEAGGQGLLAGINAVRFGRGESLVRLRRDQAYIGVLMDDLVTKTPREPYRMFTSRAEHRLLLRADNADERLTELGREIGVVDDERWQVYQERCQGLEALREHMARQKVAGKTLLDWARRPRIAPEDVLAQLNGHGSTPLPLREGQGEGRGHGADLPPAARRKSVIARLLADLQYAGYIERQKREVAKLAGQEEARLPLSLDYHRIKGLRTEAAVVLDKFRPATVGQAARLAGVNPADLMVVSVAMGR